MSNSQPYNPTRNPRALDLHAFLRREKPPHITLYISSQQHDHYSSTSIGSEERMMLKEVGTDQETLVPDSGRDRILLPTKKFSGPVGIILHFFMRKNRVQLIEQGTRQLFFKVYDYYHFDKGTPLSCKRCLHPDCNLEFTQKGGMGIAC